MTICINKMGGERQLIEQGVGCLSITFIGAVHRSGWNCFELSGEQKAALKNDSKNNINHDHIIRFKYLTISFISINSTVKQI